jgi:hypothetical protein
MRGAYITPYLMRQGVWREGSRVVAAGFKFDLQRAVFRHPMKPRATY